MSDIKILVATHKKYDMPNSDIYLPIHVGKQSKEDLGFIGDNTGDHISYKNQNYCELTALYWAWKNLDCKYIGLSHYRRYFTSANLLKRLSDKKKFELILEENEVQTILSEYDIILPKKRNYFIETVWSHYKNAHQIEDLEETKKILVEQYPEYIESFNHVMKNKSLHLYNMFVMKKESFDSYCRWLFDILFELEKRVDITNYDDYQKRIFGFISERLFNVWINKNDLKIKEHQIIHLENVNYVKKVLSLIRRKIY